MPALLDFQPMAEDSQKNQINEFRPRDRSNGPQNILKVSTKKSVPFASKLDFCEEASSFWKLNISRKEYSFWLKLSGYSKGLQTYLWVQFQVEIRLSDFSENLLPWVKNPVKGTLVLKKGIETGTLEGVYYGTMQYLQAKIHV